MGAHPVSAKLGFGQVALAASATWPFRAGPGGHTTAVNDDDGTWFQLLPAGRARRESERYRERAAAERAATAMLIREPALEFVEIAEYEVRDGGRSVIGAARIAPAQPPAPEAAEVDGLHLLPRGDPEC